MGLAPAPIYALTALSPLLVQELALPEDKLGAIVGLSFVAAAVASLPVGRLVDRLGGVVIVLGIGLATSAALASVALTLTFGTIVVAAVVSGLAQGAANPATNQIIASAVAPHERPRVVSIKQSGIPLSQLVVGAAVPVLAQLRGPATAFIVLTAMAAVVTAWAGREFAGRARTALRKPATAVAARRRSVGGWRMGALLAVSFFAGAAAQATNTYLPLYSHTGIGLSATSAGTIVGALGALGIAGRLLWSYLYGKLRRRTALLPVLCGLGVVAYGALALTATDALPRDVFWVATALHALSSLAITVVVYLALMEWVPKDAIGLASGYIGIAQFAGFALGPPAMGLAVPLLGYGWAWSTVMVAGASALVAALILSRTSHQNVESSETL